MPEQTATITVMIAQIDGRMAFTVSAQGIRQDKISAVLRSVCAQLEGVDNESGGAGA